MKYAVLIGLVIIAIPLLLRVSTQDPWPDASSYDTLHLIEHPNEPAPSFSASILRFVYGLGPPQAILLILGAITLLALSTLLDNEEFVALFVLSPVFIITFTRLDAGPLLATLIAVGAALLMRKHYWAIALLPLCFALGAAGGILASLVFIAVALSIKTPFVALGTSFIALVSSTAFALFDKGFTLSVTRSAPELSATILGLEHSATVFFVFLAVIGLVLTYREHKDRLIILLIILLPVLTMLSFGDLVVAGMLAYFGASAWNYLRERQWSFEELRSITLMIIVCGLLFTTMITVRERSSVDADRIALLRFVRDTLPQGTSIAADNTIAGSLRYADFSAGPAAIPDDPSFIASALRQQGDSYIVTNDRDPPYAHFPLVFKTESETSYKVYQVPAQ